MRTTFILLFSVFFYVVQGQILLSGRILDDRGEPLPDAAVMLSGPVEVGTATDGSGGYFLTVPQAGQYRLTVSYIGFLDAVQQIELTDGQSAERTFRLRPSNYLSELTVRAVRGGETVPFARATVDAEAIDAANLGQDVPYLLRWTPGAVVTSDAGTGIGYTGIRIRGSDPTRINVTINGIPLNDAESQGVFWVNTPDFLSSVASIEIQRGVGTSTNGAGAFGASINLSTMTRPAAKPSLTVQGSAGSFGTLRGTLEGKTGLLNSGWFAEGRLSRIHSDGYIDRATADLESWFGKVGFQSDKQSLTLLGFGGNEVTYQAWNGVPVQYIDDPDLRTFNTVGLEAPGEPYDNEVDNYTQRHAQLHYANSLNKYWTLGAAAHYTRGFGYFEQYKADQSPEDYNLGVNRPDQDIIRRLWLDNHFYGITANVEEIGVGKYRFRAGVAANRYEGLHYGEGAFVGSDFDDNRARYYENDAVKDDLSAFAKFNFPLDVVFEKWVGYADLQYRRIDYTFEGQTRENGFIDQTVNYNFWNPKAGIFYQPNDYFNAYASFAVGAHEPNRNDLTNSTPQSRPDPERLFDLELGFEQRWANAALAVNLYNMDYRDQLVVTGELNDVGEYTRINVPDSYRRGVEVTAGGQLARRFDVQGNLSVSQNRVVEFTEFIDDWASGTQLPVRHKNTPLALSPAVVTGFELGYQLFGLRDGTDKPGLRVSLLNKYVGKQYLDNTGNEVTTLDPYFFSDFRLHFDLPKPGFAQHLSANVLVRNLFDAQFVTNGWTYRFRSEGYDPVPDDPYARREGNDIYNLTGLYPQAGRNVLVGLSLTW